VRRAAFVLSLLWIAAAFGLRMYDRRPLNARVHARAAGQRRGEATIAWIEGPTRASDHGHLVVASARVDGVLEHYAARRLPTDPADCRLWLEESSEAVQAVARCPGFEPVRLTAGGRSLPAIGPYARAGTLYDLYPLTSFDPIRILNEVHPHEAATAHPALIALALIALIPLGLSSLRTFREARRRAPGEAVRVGEVTRARPGVITLRCDEQEIPIEVRDDQLEVRPLSTAPVRHGWAAVHAGAPAAVFGAVEESPAGLRLANGAVLVAGESPDEHCRRRVRTAMRELAMTAAGLAFTSLFALGHL
jgi:hypothetical protein